MTSHRIATWFLIVVAAVLVLFGSGDVVGGVTVDPGITLGLSGLTPAELRTHEPTGYDVYDFATRSQGLALTAFGIAFLAIAAIPYRAGQRWAWWAAWILPAWSAAVAALYLAHGIRPEIAPPPPMVSGPAIAGIAAILLLADRASFLRARPEVA